MGKKLGDQSFMVVWEQMSPGPLAASRVWSPQGYLTQRGSYYKVTYPKQGDSLDLINYVTLVRGP